MKTATLLSVGLGLLAGWLWGDEVRRRKNAEARLNELGKQLEKTSFKTLPPEAQLKRMALILNDAHKQISAVTKALVKPAQ
jgi:hypothetical protein